MANRTVTVTLVAKPTGLVAGLQTAKKSVKDFNGEVETLATKQGGKFTGLTNKAAIFGAGLTLAFGAVIKSAYEFDKEMSKVGAVADANSQQLGQLRKAAIDAGAATAYTATQAAQAEGELAKAGVSVTDILNGGLTGALSLAAAGGLDLADAATIAAQAMNQFALGGKSVGHVADVLTAGANKSATDVHALGDSLSQVGGVAHQAGLSLDETIGVLSLFAQQGMVGEEAGTAFKTMLLKLENPTSKSADLMESLGLKVYDAQGNFLSAANLAGQLQKALGGLTNEQRNATLGTIFGTRAVRGAVALYNAGVDGVTKWTNAVNDTGLAARTAAKMQDNLAGDVEKLKGSLDTLAIQSSGGATKGLRLLTEAATGATNVISGMPTPITSTLTVLTGVVGVTSLAGAGFAKARASIKNFMTSLAEMGPTGTKAAGALGKIGSVAGKLGVAGLAAGLLFEGFDALGKWLDKKEHPTAKQIDNMALSLQQFAQSANAGGELVKQFGGSLAGLSRDVNTLQAMNTQMARLNDLSKKAAGTQGGAGAARGLNFQRNQLLSQTKDQRKAIEELDQSLAQMVNNGNANQASIALQNLAAATGMTAEQYNALTGMLPNYTKATQGAAAASAGLAQGFGSDAANAQTMALSLQSAIDKGQTLTDVFKQLNGAAIGSKEADIEYQQAIDDLAASLGKQSKASLRGKKAWDDNTQAGRDNNKAVIDAIQKAAAHAEAVRLQTNSTDKATAAWNKDIAALKATLRAAGLTEGQINDLLKTYGKMPKAIKTPVTAPGLAKANDTATGYLRVMNALNGKKVTTNVYTKYHTSGGSSAQRFGGAYEHAAVGALRDPGIFPAAGAGARYAFAEPSTGGEAFIPKHGNLARSRAIANYVVPNWLGGQIMWPGGGGGAGGGAIEVYVTAAPGAAAFLTKQLRFEVRTKGGGDVQKAWGRR